MKYNGFYFWMFKSPMKKVLAEKYDKKYAAEIMKKSKAVYRELVEQADDIGDDIPMCRNTLASLSVSAKSKMRWIFASIFLTRRWFLRSPVRRTTLPERSASPTPIP